MNITSNWQLPDDGVRFLTPKFIINKLRTHPLVNGPYPLAAGYYPHAKGHHLKRIRHTNYLLIYCVSGYGQLRANDHNERITPGALMILPPGTVHEYAADVDDPWSIYWVHFEGKLSQEFYDHIGLHSASENIGFEQTIVSIFESNFELRRTHYDIDAFILGAHNLHRLLSLIALLKKQRKHPTGIEINLNEVREIMLDHIHGQLSLDVLSEKVQLSKYYFSKRFKTLTGESPMQYFSNLKIQRACQLLDKTPQTIKHIALSLGYDDAYYFSRLFKKTVGLSPKQYRESNHR